MASMHKDIWEDEDFQKALINRFNAKIEVTMSDGRKEERFAMSAQAVRKFEERIQQLLISARDNRQKQGELGKIMMNLRTLRPDLEEIAAGGGGRREPRGRDDRDFL